MLQHRAWQIVEDVSNGKFDYIDTQRALTASAVIIRHQQAQITRLIDLVGQLVDTQNTMPVDYEHKQ